MTLAGCVRTLRDAVRAAQGHVQDLVGSGTTETAPRDLDAIAAELETAVGGAANRSR